jgi:DNA polymerase III subunit epsilon
MSAQQLTLTVVDFESTGKVEGFPDEPWQIGMVLFKDGRVARADAFCSLLRVGQRPFNPYAPGRHARLRDRLAVAPTLPDLWPRLRPWLTGRPLCAHNAATEKRFLKNAFPLHKSGPWVDTLKLVRIAYPQLVSHKLEDLLHSLDLASRVDRLCPGLEPHDALYDSVACGILLEHLLQQPAWNGVTMETLVHARRSAIQGDCPS